MKHRELSLISKLDNGLTKGLCIMLGWLKSLSLWLLGLVLFKHSIAMIFEYNEGVADISWHEWGFFFIMALLLWRHTRYCKHFSVGYWSGLSRLLIAQGTLGVLFFICMGLLLMMLSLKGGLANFSFAVLRDHPVGKIAQYSFTLLAVYLSAPFYPSPVSKKQPAPVQAEPIIPTVTDEIAQ